MHTAILAISSLSTFAAAPISDSDLAQLRGGIALPGGLDVAIAIQTDTRVDGSLLLRTVYRVQQSIPSLVVYAPEKTISAANNGQTGASVPAPFGVNGVTVMFDRQNGPRIGPSAASAPAFSVSTTGQSDIGGAPDDATETQLPRDGLAVDVSSGRLSLTANQNVQQVQQVRLEGDQLDVRHLVGNAIGSVISNTGSDRIIDTATTVSLDISGATAANLGSTMLKIDTLVTDATAQLMPR